MALRSCDGDFGKADYMLNCSVFEFYSRVIARRRYVEWHNEKIKS